jgi:ribosomal protein S18 acetylase RimI-like enzyme
VTEVRPAESRDAAAVAGLAQEVHAMHAAALPAVFQPPGARVLTPSDVERLAGRPGHLLLVAVRADAVVGYAHAEVQAEPETAYKRARTVLYLHAMGVAAAHRGHGIGRALLDAVRRAAAARGIPEVSLDVYAFNTATRAFYRREGFVTFRERLVAPSDPRRG